MQTPTRLSDSAWDYQDEDQTNGAEAVRKLSELDVNRTTGHVKT